MQLFLNDDQGRFEPRLAESRGAERPVAANRHRAPRLSVVIPAFNEATRLPPFLNEIRDYFTHDFDGDYEVIVVDDGSIDNSRALLHELAEAWPQLLVISHTQNRGKGCAVRTGVLAAGGDLVLFADADGATPIAQEARLRAMIEQGAELAVGSRTTSAAARTAGRSVTGRVFAWLARRLTGVDVQDPQCGFKMFRRSIGHVLFELCDESGYLFDLLILGCARQLGFRIAETGIEWHEQPGSKVRLVRDSVRMLHGLWPMRRRIARLAGAQRQWYELPLVQRGSPSISERPVGQIAVVVESAGPGAGS